ncbi:MAG: calcium-translocating P-type ATPase, SERCA-type [Bacillota bacterium]
MLADWHSLEAEQCLGLLESSDNGLTAREAKLRLQQAGMNQLDQAQRRSLLGLFVDQFKDFMIGALLAATLISGLMGEYADALTIIAIVFVNAILGFIQEFRAERALSALRELTAPEVTVLRDGGEQTLDVRLLVPGDIVQLTAGVRIPADLRVLSATALEVEEAALTGESLPVRKSIRPVAQRALLGDRTSMLYAGTLVTRGHGRGLVVATGMETEMGRIASLLQEAEQEMTPLQLRLEQLGRFIVWACLAVCVAVVALGVLRGEAPTTMFLAGVSLAVAAIPEGLPAIVTIALAIGVQRMIRVNAIVRKLPAVETLGCSTVICSDKTGTLTKNEMTVRQLWLPSGGVAVSGDGYEPLGDFSRQGKVIKPLKEPDLEWLLTIGLLCNNSDVRLKDKSDRRHNQRRGSYEAKGDPTEAALVSLAGKAALSRQQLLRSWQLVDEIPFDSGRKRMTVVASRGTERFICSKGAPDVLLQRCNRYQHGKEIRRMTKEIRQAVMAAVEEMGDQALRVLAAAYRPVDRDGGQQEDELESNLILVGLYGMIDPPRPEVKAALRTCRAAGIRTVMITGDHARTARAIGLELGLIGEEDLVITGEDLDRFSAGELREVVSRGQIFARVSPHHKLQIVRQLKQAGQVVAMTGDGINDAPALMESDIGVAMGQTGTDVAKEASALVLSDDNFATIVAAVKEGRAIYDNIRKFIRYLLACNVGELLTVFLTMLLGLPLPLKPLQILWVNLVTDGLPAMALGVEAGDRDLMQRPPRQKNEGVFARGLARKILTRGLLIGVTTSCVFAGSLQLTGQLPLARTMAFATLVFCQLFHVFDCRSETLSIMEKGIFTNTYLVLAVLISTLMFLAVLYLPGPRALFDTVLLSSAQWGVVLACSGFPTLLISVRRSILRRRRRA